MARINSGLGHEQKAASQPGALAIFCPACPQPGINLPDDWHKDPKRYWNLLFICFFFQVFLDGYTQGALSLMETSLLNI
jgi:hypothetical protein